MGYSDITVLNVAIWRETGLTTLNGPALITDFAEHPRMLDYSRKWFLKAACEAAPLGPIAASDWWTEEFLDWRAKKDLERPRHGQGSPGWSWLRRGKAEGILVGGCLESLQHLRGTRFWPDWKDTILFIETSEEAPSPVKVDGILMDYENMGVFDRITGLLVGRPAGYSVEQRQLLSDVILARTAAFGFPVLTDMDFGHTAPQMTLPIGCRARIDGTAEAFEVLESAVS
jgi:muramoyltetrapeptide carboxypeptidase LdcA involved in peptidoglycan recycling